MAVEVPRNPVPSLSRLGLPLPAACALTETRLLECIPAVALGAIAARYGRDARRLSATSFRLKGAAFEIRVRDAVADTGVVCIAVGELGTFWRSDAFVCSEAKIGGYGRYTGINVSADPRLSTVADNVAEAVQIFCEDTYRRLAAQILGELLAVEHRLATQLYVEVRSVLEEPTASRVGLYGLLDDGRAMYFLDPLAIQATLARLADSRPSLDTSPLELTSTIVRGWVQTDETVAKAALADEQALEFHLEDLAYETRGFDLAERGLYGSTHLVCLPLIREGHVRLVAAYPQDLCEQVELRLVECIPRFSAIVSLHAKAARRLVGSWPSGAAARNGRYAELLGRFAGGFVSSLD